MENLRWILIFAGVAILVMLYFSGRPRRSRSRRAGSTGRTAHRSVGSAAGQFDGEAHDEFDSVSDALMGEEVHHPGLGDGLSGFDAVDPDGFSRPAVEASQAPGLKHGETGVKTGFGGSLAQKIESISAHLTPGRRQRVAASEPADMHDDEGSGTAYASKIITLHVVAPPDTLLNGPQLLNVFEQRGYHFGEMNIFHSMHEEKTVFSVAKMVEPGFFDINDTESFATPGITLILQLPGPVPADVSFEVLISEAFEMAGELGATVLDGDRSTLSKQSVQHMRESIYEYMHRQKYFGSVPS
ncbi:MAG: cell division protein ZipA C-terminal FtsZ-binding domain-containing protein [Granulosicoccus sp.]